MSLFGPSKLTLTLDKYNYIAGETITGKLILSSDTPVKTEGIQISLLGERKNSSITFNSQSISHSNSTTYFYNGSITILPGGEYIREEIPFSYHIPQDIIRDEGNFFEKLGNFPPWVIMIMNLLISLSRLTGPRYNYQFTVRGIVDIPWGIDMKEEARIDILPIKIGNIQADSIIPPEIKDMMKDKNSQSI